MIIRSEANKILTSLVRSNTNNYYYLGLSTTTPDPNGGNFTEPKIPSGAVDDDGKTITENEYQRVNLAGYLEEADNAIIKSNAIIFFNEAEHYAWADNGKKITHFGIFTTKTALTPIFWGELTTPVEVPKNYIPIFRAGKLQIGLDNDPANPV